jgi:hypothetical protein
MRRIALYHFDRCVTIRHEMLRNDRINGAATILEKTIE